ncbi:MAG TPA: DMT family transporter [Acidimicrobiales bacterium]|nr:DMT family transporter [Acidimicrobiales bacterium]
MVVALALAAALAYAAGAVLQQHQAARAPSEQVMRVRLLVYLAARPLWLLGIGADVAGYALQFVALGHGSLVLVQPLLVCGLLFALPLSAMVNHRRSLTRAEWSGAAAVVAGLALFLVVAAPGEGATDASGMAWVIVSTATLGPAAVCAALASGRTGSARSLLLAVAAGLVYGAAAAYTRPVAAVVTAGGGLGHMLVSVVTAWQAYAVVATGVAGLLLAQSAFQSGPLVWSLPALTVLDPLASVAIGATALHEGMAHSPAAMVAEVVGMGVLCWGVTVLSRSPLAPQRVDAT